MKGIRLEPAPMPDSIFSTYRTGENRVTASILAVLRSLALQRTERLLGALMERSEFELVSFQNQPAKGGQGVPDASITASCRLLVETKITRNAVKGDQIHRHLERLDAAPEAAKFLLILTPDEVSPAVLTEEPDPRVAWASFAALDQAIEELLKDPYEVISEREEFLLRELQAMLAEEGLVSLAHDVVVVPARDAWPEYGKFHAYVCQPKRAFQGVRRLAFYTNGAIQPLVPTILETRDEVQFEPGINAGALGALVDRMLDAGVRERGQFYKVMLLSAPDDSRTLKLERRIENDLTAGSGRTTAFTQNQRYVAEEKLRKARTTSDLV
jgi:hypothetical protein